MKKIFVRLSEFMKRLSCHDIQEMQLDEQIRVRKLLIAILDHSTRVNQKTKMLDNSISIFQKDFSRYFQSHEKILEIVRSEPFSALHKWIDQSVERTREDRYTINQLIIRWNKHAEGLEARIDHLQKELVQKDKHIARLRKNTEATS